MQPIFPWYICISISLEKSWKSITSLNIKGLIRIHVGIYRIHSHEWINTTLIESIWSKGFFLTLDKQKMTYFHSVFLYYYGSRIQKKTLRIRIQPFSKKNGWIRSNTACITQLDHVKTSGIACDAKDWPS